ncbi:hypothetical protein SEA_JEHOSHAPHAT_101 [Microbacterium phage Jehoshaphat]|nr:hypothetical protein SEA_TEEHEE_100 [Microbacterium phage Teehee]QXN73494.1 hypothetical protein SEA_JEHOSHAPHAT_101 [Microbacterium phage Jehoshaphat]WKW84967.1 hypothetical protein SEA_SALLYK_101 [Microbacterium phage SallyK]
MSRTKHARDLKPGDIVTASTSPIALVDVFPESGVRVRFEGTEFGTWYEPLEAVRVLNDCDSCEHRVHEGSCIIGCACRRGCPACVGHGVVSGVRMVEIKPGTYREVVGDRPCLLCNPLASTPINLG